MDIETLEKYIGHKVFLTLKNGFKYKFILNRENISGTTVSFKGKWNEDVDFDISEIAFITISSGGDK